MERRRAHEECAAEEGGCEIIVGSTCRAGKGVNTRKVVQKFWNGKLGRSGAWMTMWVIGLLVMSFVINLAFIVRWYVGRQQ